MPAHWECRCGERFDRYGFDFTSHIKEGKTRGEDHGIRGLVDEETGEVLAMNLPQAVKRGLVPPSARKTSADSSTEETSDADNGDHEAQGDGKRRAATTVRGRFVTQEVLLDGRLLLLYDLARQRFPQWTGTVGEWIWDCVVQFYVEHTDQLGLGELFEDTVEVQRA